LEGLNAKLGDNVDRLYASLDIPQRFPPLQGISFDFIRILLLACDLKVNIRKRAIASFFEWERLDQVTIAAVNGFAIGGGLSLAMACDFRISAAGARIWIPEVALGVPYMWGSVSRLINLVGMSKAKEMIMTCDEVSAEEAFKIGLVNQVVSAERLIAAALEFAGKLMSKPPMALRRTKDFFKALGNGRLGDITYADGYLGLSCLASDDMSEAMTAFKERRPGRYRGR